ncbi:MAG: pilus assembly protein, partial [Selenomonadaceae bacterium]|nr:pilus assembly protein [Selenomonadaceae bacterium]
MLKKFLHNQRGQMLVLYALLTPLLFFVGGAAVDLGWYYFNASRLQNMADSAIMASAKVLTKTDGEFSNYRYNYILPYVPKELTPEDRNSESGDLEAKKYISKNLDISTAWISENHVTDNFSDVELTFKKETFPTKDADDYPILYYEITLTETPNHLFSFL